MEHDLTELARICLKHAKAAKAPKLAAALLGMAKEYQRRATRLHEGKEQRRSERRRP
jgi:hypothetical protein